MLIRAADGRQPSFHPSKEKALGGVSTSLALAKSTPMKGVTAHSDNNVGEREKNRASVTSCLCLDSKDTSYGKPYECEMG